MHWLHKHRQIPSTLQRVRTLRKQRQAFTGAVITRRSHNNAHMARQLSQDCRLTRQSKSRPSKLKRLNSTATQEKLTRAVTTHFRREIELLTDAVKIGELTKKHGKVRMKEIKRELAVLNRMRALSPTEFDAGLRRALTDTTDNIIQPKDDDSSDSYQISWETHQVYQRELTRINTDVFNKRLFKKIGSDTRYGSEEMINREGCEEALYLFIQHAILKYWHEIPELALGTKILPVDGALAKNLRIFARHKSQETFDKMFSNQNGEDAVETEYWELQCDDLKNIYIQEMRDIDWKVSEKSSQTSAAADKAKAAWKLLRFWLQGMAFARKRMHTSPNSP